MARPRSQMARQHLKADGSSRATPRRGEWSTVSREIGVLTHPAWRPSASTTGFRLIRLVLRQGRRIQRVVMAVAEKVEILRDARVSCRLDLHPGGAGDWPWG